MQLFTVIRKGVYRHEQIGVFDSDAKAGKAAIEALRQEYDTYHTMLVLESQLNVSIAKNLDDEKILWTYFRREDSICRTSWAKDDSGQTEVISL
jgi:hypothetical protein